MFLCARMHICVRVCVYIFVCASVFVIGGRPIDRLIQWAVCVFQGGVQEARADAVRAGAGGSGSEQQEAAAGGAGHRGACLSAGALLQGTDEPCATNGNFIPKKKKNSSRAFQKSFSSLSERVRYTDT